MSGLVTLSDPCPACGVVCRWVYTPAEGTGNPMLRIECVNPACPSRLTPQWEPEAAA
jgi:hypothetical protein